MNQSELWCFFSKASLSLLCSSSMLISVTSSTHNVKMNSSPASHRASMFDEHIWHFLINNWQRVAMRSFLILNNGFRLVLELTIWGIKPFVIRCAIDHLQNFLLWGDILMLVKRNFIFTGNRVRCVMLSKKICHLIHHPLKITHEQAPHYKNVCTLTSRKGKTSFVIFIHTFLWQTWAEYLIFYLNIKSKFLL